MQLTILHFSYSPISFGRPEPQQTNQSNEYFLVFILKEKMKVMGILKTSTGIPTENTEGQRLPITQVGNNLNCEI